MNSIKTLIVKFIKDPFALKFYNIVIWYIYYIFSGKIISYIFNIDEDSLKLSPTIWAMPVSIGLIYSLIVISAIFPLFIMQVFAMFSVFVTINIKRKILGSNLFNFCKNYYYLIIVLSPMYMVVAVLTPYVAKASLLADATYVSDCGPKRYDKMYLKANDHACYELTLDRNFFSADPQLIPKPAKK